MVLATFFLSAGIIGTSYYTQHLPVLFHIGSYGYQFLYALLSYLWLLRDTGFHFCLLEAEFHCEARAGLELTM